MGVIEEKVFDVEGLKKFLLEEFNFKENDEINQLLYNVRSITTYGDAKYVEMFINAVKKLYAKMILKVYEHGLTDGIKLSYEIRERDKIKKQKVAGI